MNNDKLVQTSIVGLIYNFNDKAPSFLERIIFSKLTVTNVSLDRCGEILELGDQIGSAVKHEIKFINKYIRRRY